MKAPDSSIGSLLATSMIALAESSIATGGERFFALPMSVCTYEQKNKILGISMLWK
jgi:hypothetical protein